LPALNSLTQTGKTITVTITADVTTEDGTNYLTGAAGMWTSLTMLPTGHRTISGSSGPGGLFEINGAKYITINGRNDGTNSLIIENTSTGGPTIRLLNGATNNTVTNATVNGCSTGWV